MSSNKTSKGSDQPAHTRNLIRAFASSLNILLTVKLLVECHLKVLSLKGGCIGVSESTLVKSHVPAQIMNGVQLYMRCL